MRSFSQLPMKVPNWHDWTWSCNVSKNLSLNWNVAGNCCANCQVQSMNCVNTGDTSLESPATWPHRSLNLWPNASHSFSIRAYRTNNHIFFHLNYDLSPVSPVQCNLTLNGTERYEGRLISNAHSEIFCQRSKVAILAQCVLVATTLLHSGEKFHSFLYTGSKTVRVNIESCYGGMSTRLKQRAVTEFLSTENVTPAEIHRRLQAVWWKHC